VQSHIDSIALITKAAEDEAAKECGDDACTSCKDGTRRDLSHLSLLPPSLPLCGYPPLHLQRWLRLGLTALWFLSARPPSPALPDGRTD